MKSREIAITNALSLAWKNIQTLQQEVEKSTSGLTRGFSHTKRYRILQGTLELLTDVVSHGEPELPIFINGEVTVSIPKRYVRSRADRRNESIDMLSSAKTYLEHVMSHQDPQRKGAVDQLITKITRIITEIKGAQFPGQRQMC